VQLNVASKEEASARNDGWTDADKGAMSLSKMTMRRAAREN
jgi:hypothetical protein